MGSRVGIIVKHEAGLKVYCNSQSSSLLLPYQFRCINNLRPKKGDYVSVTRENEVERRARECVNFANPSLGKSVLESWNTKRTTRTFFLFFVRLFTSARRLVAFFFFLRFNTLPRKYDLIAYNQFVVFFFTSFAIRSRRYETCAIYKHPQSFFH